MKKSKKIVLDLCGGSGTWGKPYADAGYRVLNITLPDWDILDVGFEAKHLVFRRQPRGGKPLRIRMKDVVGVLAAPPCTKFSKANTRLPRAKKDFAEGMETVEACLKIVWALQMKGAPLAFWALENPQGYLSRFLGKSVLQFQHWQYGETRLAYATKRTEIWGYFKLPAKTTHERTVPHIKKFTDRRTQATLFGDDLTSRVRNKQWEGMTAANRALTCPGFAAAFFKANCG